MSGERRSVPGETQQTAGRWATRRVEFMHVTVEDVV